MNLDDQLRSSLEIFLIKIRSKIINLPLSEDAQRNSESRLKFKQYNVAGSTPRRNSTILTWRNVSNTLIKVPFLDAVAINVPGFNNEMSKSISK